jgi:hypothetical protein
MLPFRNISYLARVRFFDGLLVKDMIVVVYRNYLELIGL